MCKENEGTMALTHIVRGIGRKAVVAGAVGLASVGYNSRAEADQFVNNSMDYTTINNVIAGATSGETVFFDCGTYQLPMVAGASFVLNNEGVNLAKDACGGEVVLRGATPTSGGVMMIVSNDNTVSGLKFTNSHLGVRVNASVYDPTKPINITGNDFDGTGGTLERAVSWTNKDVVGSNTLPSVRVTGNTLTGVDIGQLFDQMGEPTTAQASWAEVANNTYDGLNFVGFDPPLVFGAGNSPEGTLTVLGFSEFSGNIIINSDGIPMPPIAYQGTPFNGATTGNFPDGNGEFNINNDYPPCPPECYPGSFEELYGGNNFTGDPMFTIHLRPLPGSPAIGPQHGPRNYVGARAPAGDFNGDGHVTDFDYTRMIETINKNNVDLTINELRSGDMNSDNLVDGGDMPLFAEAYNGTFAIPATSTWGNVIGGLGLLTIGSLVYRKRSNQTLGTS